MVGKPQNLKRDVGSPKACEKAAIDKRQTRQGDAETLNKKNGWETPNPKKKNVG